MHSYPCSRKEVVFPSFITDGSPPLSLVLIFPSLALIELWSVPFLHNKAKCNNVAANKLGQQAPSLAGPCTHPVSAHSWTDLPPHPLRHAVPRPSPHPTSAFWRQTTHNEWCYEEQITLTPRWPLHLVIVQPLCLVHHHCGISTTNIGWLVIKYFSC